jgi:hypothetical protein
MRIVVPFVIAGILGTCDQQSGAPSSATENVTIVVTIDRAQFAPTATLDVRVWNAAQLAILEASPGCATVKDPQTGETRLQCPDEIQYRDVTPERFEYPLESLGSELEVRSASVRVGERFRIRVSGLYRDKCNTTSADRVLQARSARTTVGNLTWHATAKACLEGAIS